MSLKGLVPPDPQTKVSEEHFAVVFSPRISRKRFPAGCVTLVDTENEAIEQSNAEKKLRAAGVIGPSKSSEGQFIFYLVEWLSI